MRYAVVLSIMVATTVLFFVWLANPNDAGTQVPALTPEAAVDPTPVEATATPQAVASPTPTLTSEVMFVDGLFDISLAESTLVAAIELAGEARATGIEVSSLRLCLGTTGRCEGGAGGAQAVAVTDRDADGLPELLVAFGYREVFGLVRNVTPPRDVTLTVAGRTAQDAFAASGTVIIVDGANPPFATTTPSPTETPPATAGRAPAEGRAMTVAAAINSAPLVAATPTVTPEPPTATPQPPPPPPPAVVADNPPPPPPPDTATPVPAPSATPTPQPEPAVAKPRKPAPQPVVARPPRDNDDRDRDDDGDRNRDDSRPRRDGRDERGRGDDDDRKGRDDDRDGDTRRGGDRDGDDDED